MNIFFPLILSTLPQSNTLSKKRMAWAIKQTWKNFFPCSPEEGNFINNLGVLCFEMHLYKRAVFFFKKALDENPKQAQAHYNLGLCYQMLKKYNAAQLSFKKAQGLDPSLEGSFSES